MTFSTGLDLNVNRGVVVNLMKEDIEDAARSCKVSLSSRYCRELGCNPENINSSP